MKKMKVMMLGCMLAAGVCMFAACGARDNNPDTNMEDTNNVGNTTEGTGNGTNVNPNTNTDNNTNNTGGTGKMYDRTKVINQARAWLGCNEADGTHKKIIDNVVNGVEDAGNAVKDTVDGAVDAVDPAADNGTGNGADNGTNNNNSTRSAR